MATPRESTNGNTALNQIIVVFYSLLTTGMPFFTKYLKQNNKDATQDGFCQLLQIQMKIRGFFLSVKQYIVFILHKRVDLMKIISLSNVSLFNIQMV